MTYVKHPWLPKGAAGALLVTSARLNEMEQGIADAHPTGAPTTRAIVLGTAYQPNPARPTLVATSVGANANSQVDINIGPTAGTVTRIAICGSTGFWTPCIFIVPANYFYVLGASAGSPNVLGNAVTEIAL